MFLRRGALGLRGRIVGAVLVTTVATLVVAALALLGPLENSLRRAALTTLKSEVRGAQSTFAQLRLDYVLSAGATTGPTEAREIGRSQEFKLREAQSVLGQRSGATVLVFGYNDADGLNAKVLAPPVDPDVLAQQPRNLVAAAYRTGQTQFKIATIGEADSVVAAIPFSTLSKAHPSRLLSTRYVIAVTKPIDEVADAVTAVRRAFIDAALAGLALMLMIAIPLSFRIVRRLRRLREAALELAEQGPPVEVPGRRARDEVGDLARAFSLMQSQLQQQEEARRAFVATASHELRTPLTSLEGMLELLAEDLNGAQPDLDDARDMLSRARAQSHRLGRLAADLLDLSRLDAQVQLRSEPVELGELSRAVLAEFELGTTEREVVCELHEAAEPVWALGDPGSVARILRILIDNAMRVSPPGSEIHVELGAESDAELRVCDQGPGVPDEERDQIFQRFHRGRNTSGQAGFGLGLAIGRELAQRMGGELVLERTSADGATFTLHLPKASAPEPDTLAVL